MKRLLRVLGVVALLAVPSPVAAGGDEIETEFAMVENSTFVDPITGAIGSGEIEIDGEDLDDLEFELEIEAEGLTPNTWYGLGVTVREGFDGTAVPVATVVVGMARTDDEGELEFEGESVLPDVFSGSAQGATWRIDQQVILANSGTKNNCVDCILVCAPTTKVEVVDSELVPFGTVAEDDDDDDDD